MARWTAKCWLGSKSGYQNIEVSANTIGGAKEQLQDIYGAEQIINLRQIREESSGSGIELPSDGRMWLVGLVGAGALFLYFTPWVLMFLYGGIATWVSQKMTGQTFEEYGENDESTPEEHKKAAIVFCSAFLFGMIGFIHGTVWNGDLNKQYDLDGKQSHIQEVRK